MNRILLAYFPMSILFLSMIISPVIHIINQINSSGFCKTVLAKLTVSANVASSK